MPRSVKSWRNTVAKEFRHARFGMIPSDLSQPMMDMNEQVFKSFLRNCGTGALMSSLDSHVEIFSLGSHYIGDNFRNWLIANYYNGKGVRSELVSKIVAYIQGEVTGNAVTNQLKIDNTKLTYAPPGKQIAQPMLFKVDDFRSKKDPVEHVNFNVVKNEHMYDFFALIGPEGLARLCLSLDGTANG